MPRRSLIDPPRTRPRSRTLDQEGPTLAELIGATIALRTEFDSGKRAAIAGTLTKFTGGSSGGNGDGYTVPPAIARSMLPDTRDLSSPTITRTGVGYQSSGPGGYGFALEAGFSSFVADRARTTVGPCDFFNWWPVKTREFRIPAVSEASLADGSRFGGFTGTWVGNADTTVPAAVDGKLSQAVFWQERLLIATQISRDIWSDSVSLAQWLSYAATAEIRNKLEIAVLNGNNLGIQGVINEKCTVVTPKGATSSAQISAINIDAMWASLAEGNSENAVWHCNKNTLNVIDQLAVSGQFPEGLYRRPGESPMGIPWATIKGKPIIPMPWCATVGTIGDIILVDWSDYVFTYLQMNPAASALSFSIDIPRDDFHKGVRGVPEGAIEQRVSDQQFFSTDTLAVLFKLRGCGRFTWNTTATDYSGNTIGPCVVLASR